MRPPSEITAELEAIDATLAGQAVDPRHAELAELSLLLSDLRPALEPPAASRLDARLAAVERRAPRRPRRWHPRALGALAGAAAAAALAVAVIGGAGGSGTPGPVTESAPAGPERSPQAQLAAPAATAGGAAAAPAAAQPAPGRAVVQSAQLTLSAAPNRIEAVSSEVYAVVASAGGFVENSSVTQTGGPDGFAHFTLSLPSSGLATGMSQLSRLRYSQVASRTDGAQDVTGTLDALTRRLGDARALRTSLLRQLAAATTPAQLAGLRGQLHDASVLIDRLSAELGRLRRAVAHSAVTVTVQAGSTVPAHHHSRSTLARALHDAGRVLSAIAGVAVLVAAVVLPLIAAALLCAWGWLRLRRHWRELALRD